MAGGHDLLHRSSGGGPTIRVEKDPRDGRPIKYFVEEVASFSRGAGWNGEKSERSARSCLPKLRSVDSENPVPTLPT